jgi:hypothetical protein
MSKGSRRDGKSAERGLGLPRSDFKPIPKRFSREEAELMRLQKEVFGIGYRVLARMHRCAIGCAHHAVAKRGAYAND